MMSQKEGVFNAIGEVLGGVTGEVKLSSEQRKEVVEAVVAGFISGTIELAAKSAAKYDSEAKLKGYAGGLVSNWLRKDTRLNGGAPYEAKNPGSRAGKDDDALKALKALRKTLTDATQIADVDAEIETRVAAFKASKLPKVEIDTTLIPESLRHLVG